MHFSLTILSTHGFKSSSKVSPSPLLVKKGKVLQFEVLFKREKNILLVTTESPQFLLLARAEWYKVSNILQDNHYFTTETKKPCFAYIFMRERGVDARSDQKAQLRAREMNYTDVCYKSLT